MIYVQGTSNMERMYTTLTDKLSKLSILLNCGNTWFCWIEHDQLFIAKYTLPSIVQKIA